MFFEIVSEIERLLNDVGKILKDYASIPFPEDVNIINYENRLIAEELGYDTDEMKLHHSELFPNLNKEQLNVYNRIVDNVDRGTGGIFFRSWQWWLW